MNPGPNPRERVEGRGTTTVERPTWCGECDQRTRLQELPEGTMRRCPRCHPLAGQLTPGQRDALRQAREDARR